MNEHGNNNYFFRLNGGERIGMENCFSDERWLGTCREKCMEEDLWWTLRWVFVSFWAGKLEACPADWTWDDQKVYWCHDQENRGAQPKIVGGYTEGDF